LPPSSTKGGKALAARGEVLLQATPEAVFRVLLDPAALAKVIPGCNKLEPAGEHRYRADVTVGVGMIKARYSAEVELSELDPPRSLRLAGAGLSSVGSARGSGLVSLAPSEAGTLLRYDYSAEVSGKVAAVGGRMLEGAAKIVLNQLFEQLGREAGGQGGAAAPAPKRSLWQRLLALLGVKS
jgi:2-furoyl-CoA dehydrogenase large subunit